MVAAVAAAALAVPVTPVLGAESGPNWRLEQPAPPAPPAGVLASAAPVGLGEIGDIAFWSPNRGVLITGGNGTTIPAGIWAYNGRVWHELSTVCGSGEGRIAWAGPDEFWTISDGRPGQAASLQGELPPLEADTLCHFSDGEVVASYAQPGFEPTSYLEMHGAACLSATDCWFAGEQVLAPGFGAFQLHWNGAKIEPEPYPAEGYAVESMSLFDHRIYEGVDLSTAARVEGGRLPEPPVLHTIGPEGVSPVFESIATAELPLYAVPKPSKHEFPEALGALRLTAAESELWGVAPAQADPSSQVPGQLTVLRQSAGKWVQALGPRTKPSGSELERQLSVDPENPGFNEGVVDGVAAEPGSASVWLALDSPRGVADPSPVVRAVLARIATEHGPVAEEVPAPGETTGPRGAARRVVCPAHEDCWMATTQGWLFHYSNATERELPEDQDPAFAGVIAYRPPDEGLPFASSAGPPEDDSGVSQEAPEYGKEIQTAEATTAPRQRRTVALVARVKSALRHDVLELRFHLAVKARVRLVAKRSGRVVAATAREVLRRGDRHLLLGLDPRRWPTKLELQTHALAPLPTVVVHHSAAKEETISTSVAVLPGVPRGAGATSPLEPGLLP